MPSATNVTPEFIEANHSRDAILEAGWAVLEKNPDTALRTNYIKASELEIKAETREEFHTLMRELFEREIADTKMDGDGPITAIKLEWDGDTEFDLEVSYEVVKNDKVAYELGVSALIDQHTRDLEKQEIERIRQKRAEQRKETQESIDRRELKRLLEQYPDVAKELMADKDI